MKKIFLILLVCPFLSFSQSNSQFKIVVKNSISKEPIQYAEIYFQKIKKTQLTDSLGQMDLKKKPKGKITISCLGFKSKTLLVNSKLKIVFLSPIKNKLDEVIIQASKKVVDYGFLDIPTNFLLPTAHVNTTFYPAVYIKNPNPKTLSYIKEIKARIKTSDKNEQGKIRLHLYRFDPSTKTIGKKILNENLIFNVGYKNNIKKFDIKSEHVKLPKKGVLVALQLVNNAKTVIIRCGKDKKIKANYSYLVPGFKLKNKIVNVNIARQLKFDKKYPLMIGISVEQF